jgi:hypothetical protein
MNERRLEVADVFRLQADDSPTQWGHVLARHQKKAIADIRNCRTAAMAGMWSNRNCPRCQAAARAEWLAEREANTIRGP